MLTSDKFLGYIKLEKLYVQKGPAKNFENQNKPLDTNISSIQKKMLKTHSLILDLIKNKRFDEAAGYIVGICELSDLLKKQIEVYITQFVLPIYETEAKVTFTFEDVKRKKDDVYEWLNEIEQITNKLRDKIRTRNLEDLLRDSQELLEKIGYDKRFSDFINTLAVIITEFEMYYIRKPEDKLMDLFDRLNLHPIIRKSSRKLFKDGHYAEAIFEAYKALINYVKEKLGIKTLDGEKLMSHVFSMESKKETLRRLGSLFFN